ncbi:aldo/keto reductase [Levilactobacillus brevis]|jgi:pyridoxine 4-dehydrogenase|uniref:Aryl-alcohol dehydrogenase related enzyme n=1 Tax=Levilactobacillus brevis (strain ATCC 367 / BCRC 12310 / CIP 105137 / JCM 1170 / LMG 11437 / NCIMB 947 / NCTC 947) TaxID=387344 RepID=Q03U52_LEVBA|nr:aldo/keto reductase [Levilactobacillus brevis]MBT1152760.1 aldo/keto reductase [Lactiplantibacillus argentoratensis]ABJ63270.1 Aryl-alcohol dehydrogenase related enzyme [Levilactobacillus brevis ATCC 367]ARQ93020.1 aldo/keto reductase [Levilactobacillus brevis]ARW21018.1 putative oxidoreductase YdjG [Levilactobacillus brevis]KLE29237.1 aldo/keto reductase [Levilactobacillus brevis]
MEKTFTFDSDLTVNRLGYGTMQLTGDGVWGPVADPDNAVKVIETAIDHGVNFIDTADAYGPFYANLYLRDALKNRPDNHVMVATKVGNTRQGPDVWTPVGVPAYLRQQVEMNLFTLGLDHIDLLQLHRVDPNVPLADQIGVLKDMQDEGKIKHIGLSQVSVDQLKEAAAIAPIVSVQNMYNLSNRQDEDVLDYADAHHIAFIPWFPLATGELIKDATLTNIAQKYNASPAQIALAWLLKRSDVILPIPGTKSSDHELQNIQAQDIDLSQADFDALKALAK